MTARPWQNLDDCPTDAGVSGAAAVAVAPVGSIAPANSPSGVERRAAPRRTHRVFQWIAPCIDDQLPDRSMFYQVQCVDISTTGIAFFTDEPLACSHCIIALGTTEDAFYVRAEIVEQRVVDSDSTDLGRETYQIATRFRIGCEFVERYGKQQVDLPAV